MLEHTNCKKNETRFKSLNKIQDIEKREKLRELYSRPDFPDNYGTLILDGWLNEINRILNN